MQTLSTADLIKKKFIGTDDLRKRLTEILNKLPEQGGEIIVTQHGRPQAILLDLESYLDLHETIEDLQRPGFIESIYKFPKKEQVGILEKIESILENPRKFSIKLETTQPTVYRLRAGEYRIFFGLDDREKIMKIAKVERRTTQTYR